MHGSETTESHRRRSGPASSSPAGWRPARAWSAAERHALAREPSPAARSLPPEDLAALIIWIAAAPEELVLNEVIATPLEEQGWS
jgi:hypothetical protein